jgi:hypothetical protein
MGNGLCKGIEHQEGSEIGCPRLFELVGTSSSSNQDARTHPGVLSCLQVANGIPNTDGTSKVQTIAFGCLKEEPRFRFPACAGILRGVGTQKGVIHPAAGSMYHLENIVLNLKGSLQRDDTSTDGRLIGNQDNLNWSIFQLCQNGQRLGQEGYILNGADIIVPIFDDDPITVEE